MKKLIKNSILFVLVAGLFVFLIFPELNPFLDESGKAALSAQLKDAFSTLIGGAGYLTPARIISALAVVLFVGLVCMVICGLLALLAKTGKQRKSMASLFSSLTKLVGIVVAIVWALNILGVNIAGIFASLGIASLIIGFGAQSLIEDAITGIFIIFEGQYNVGDVIVLDDFRGVVRNIGIRTTAIEDTGGNMKIVNNSDIRNLQNRSKNLSVAVCDVSISYSANIEEVEAVILAALPGIYERNTDVFAKQPKYQGVDSLGESSVVMRLTVEVTEENFFIGRRRLNKEIKMLFDQNGIEIPFNQLVIHQAEN